MVHKLVSLGYQKVSWFENDVKMYGTQAFMAVNEHDPLFETDVKMYGTQARRVS